MSVEMKVENEQLVAYVNGVEVDRKPFEKGKSYTASLLLNGGTYDLQVKERDHDGK